ncbi:MAG: DsbA family protein [Natronincolaceae bacterium]|nr:DsbA family protein [Bacillota bacterium]
MITILNIKIFSDFACPFCYIAFSMLEKLKSEGVKFDAEWYAYEIRPEAPLEGEESTLKFFKEEAQKMDKIFEMITKFSEPYGIKFSRKYISFSTNRAHLAGEYAKTQGKYSEFSKEIFKAYFESFENIADKEVINKIATKIGLNIDEMNEQVDSGKFDNILLEAMDAAEQYEVENVPTFVINETHKMTGIRDYEQFKNNLLSMEG